MSSERGIRRIGREVVPVVAALTMLAGCSIDNYSEASVRRDLREAGLSAEQARCVADEMEKAFGAAVLATRGEEPTTADLADQREILEACGVDL